MIYPSDILSVETWILLVSVIILIRLYIHRKWQVLKKLNIPHDPPSIMGLGNMGEMFKNPASIFENDLRKKKKFGYIYGSYLWLAPRISISDPETMKQILIKESSTFRDRQKAFGKINGKEMNTSLLAVSGDQWKRIRSTLSPTFSTSKLKKMIGIIESCTDHMTANLRRIPSNEEGRFDAKKTFGNLSMDVICSAAFSTNVHSQDNDESELVKRTKELFVEFSRLKNPMMFLFLLLPWTTKIAEKFNYSVFPRNFMEYYRKLTDKIIKNKEDPNYETRVDIMQQMLENEITDEEVQAGATIGMTRYEIIGNSILMIMAGYETTANTLIFFAYCLATNKESQNKLREEILASIEKNGGLTYEGINNMKYLDMSMKESQRLYGATPRNSRFTEKSITVNGIHIPARTHVDFPLYGMNHDEEYWDEPWEYKPERFEDPGKIDPIIFQPFGAGPRNCIGMRFAIMEVKVAICKLVQQFDIDVCDDTPKPPIPMTIRGSLQPKDNVFLKAIPREDS